MRTNQAEISETASNIHPFPSDTSSHDALISRLQETLTKSFQDVSEDDLWERIAQNHSPEWIAAREALKKTQEQVDEMNSPENVSLGLIGAALDSEEKAPVMEAHHRRLAEFTLINEVLKQREDLMQVFKTLVAQKKMLEAAQAQTKKLQELTEEAVMPTFMASAKKKAKSFRGIFGLNSGKSHKIKLQTVPSSPEI